MFKAYFIVNDLAINILHTTKMSKRGINNGSSGGLQQRGFMYGTQIDHNYKIIHQFKH